MNSFAPHSYGPAVARLLEQEPLCPLGPGSPHTALRQQLDALDRSSLLAGRKAADADMADCCISGLWLLFDFLDKSHTISQEIHTASGSYWHGIMHRREPDYGNSKYWFRRVGSHPVFEALQQDAAELAGASGVGKAKPLAQQSAWDPFRFIDLCEQAAREGGELETLCRDVARAEWRLLFDYCYRQAAA